MAGYNGSGTFVRVHNWVTDKGNAVKVTASRMDAEDDGFATGLSTAICKDGQTTTTAAIPFAVGIKLSDGSVGTPALNFISDTDSGFYRIGANNVGLSLGGSKVWDFGTATASAAGSLVLGGTLAASGGISFGDGAEATPSITFASDPNSGFYSSAADAIGLSLGGSKVIDFNTTGISVTGTLTSSGALTVSSGGAAVTGNSTVTGTLGVSSDFAVNTSNFTVAGASGNTVVAGTLGVTGNVAINTDKFTVTAASGNTSIAGTLGVTGAATLASIAGSVVASQSDQETGTSTSKVVTPGTQQSHASAAKAWVYFQGSDTVTILRGYNVTSITDNNTGDYTINFTTAFSDANYSLCGSSQSTGTTNNQTVCNIMAASATGSPTNKSTSACRISYANASTGGLTDFANNSAHFFGDQA